MFLTLFAEFAEVFVPVVTLSITRVVSNDMFCCVSKFELGRRSGRQI